MSEIEAALARQDGPPLSFPAPGWEGFYATYPNSRGYMVLSLPGYSRDGDTAVIYVASAAGLYAGSGFVHVLKREGDHWRVIESNTAWIS